MRKIATAGEMQAIDRFTIEDCGIPGLALMENAGIRVADMVWARFAGQGGASLPGKVLVFAGKGNNGGDGFVVARHLFNRGADVQVFLLGKRAGLKQDAKTNADSAFRIGVPIKEINEKTLKSCDHPLRHCRIVIDAIFGTGLTSAVGGLYEKVIKKINSAGKYVVSIDMPSGIESDGGGIIGPHVAADLTVALGLMKRSHLLFPAAEAMGEVRVADIGLPARAVDRQPVGVYLVEEADIRRCFPKRPADSHKGHYGHVLVIGGSRGKGGAAGLAAVAALRAGAGLVSLALPENCHRSLEFNPLEVMSIPLPETAGGAIDCSAGEIILKHCRGKTAVVIGPGISTGKETVQLLEEVLPRIECPLVVDADGLNGIALSKGLISRLPPHTVLTPHPKEMARICGKETREILQNRIEAAREPATKNLLCVVLKGARTLIAVPDGTVYVNPTGNPGMATAGSGDVLAGLVAGLAAQGLDPKSACISAVYLHGLAGDMFAAESSQTSLIAGDLLRCLPEAMKRILP
ncbi:MAG: NAD(P)H-hydrate dehydratase [Nitrospinales bacterium]